MLFSAWRHACFVLREYKLTEVLGQTQNHQYFLTLDNITELSIRVISLVPLFSLTLVPDLTWNNKPWAPGSSEHPCLVAHLEHCCTSLLGMKICLWICTVEQPRACPLLCAPVHCQPFCFRKPCLSMTAFLSSVNPSRPLNLCSSGDSYSPSVPSLTICVCVYSFSWCALTEHVLFAKALCSPLSQLGLSL